MINEGLRISLSAPSPDESIAILLEYLGKALQSERVYIFEEVGGNCFSNTYEWCASGVSQEKDNLQNLPFEVVSIWIDRFHDNENVIIRNLDDIKDSDPLMYDCLFPQNIHSLVAGPLFNNNKIIGFYGVDNPPQKMLGNISVLFQIMGHFLGSLLKRRNLVRRLVNLSFYDQLTGCKNRHAMNEYVRELRPRDSIGIIYGDVTGLKKVNDTLGHEAGDQLLIQASDCLKRVFPEDQVFRMGGDEFLVLYSKVTEDELLRQIKLLEADMKEHDVVIAIGYVWRPDSTENIDKLLMEADEQMYENKRAYYEKHQMSRV
jgi:diguanylate cyclase (GGDEF)-like protein